MTPDEQAKELDRARDRLHKLAATVQAHDTMLVEHKTLLEFLRSQAESLQRLPKELVDAAAETLRLQFTVELATVKTELATVKTQLTADIKRVEEALKPIQQGVTGIVWLILAAVVGAILTVVFKR